MVRRSSHCSNNWRAVNYLLAAVTKRPKWRKYWSALGGGLIWLGCNSKMQVFPLNVNGVPEYDPTTMKISGHSVYLAGDVNADRPILHEASDEGTIAGFNAVADQPQRFRRKTPFAITFSDPNIALIGQSFDQLDAQETAIASITMAPVGRALILGKNRGLIRLYAEKKSGKLIGAALLAVHAEHLGHLLAWSIEQQMTVLQMLEMPFYHPVIEEALQPVLRDLVKACDLTIDRPVGLRLLGT